MWELTLKTLRHENNVKTASLSIQDGQEQSRPEESVELIR